MKRFILVMALVVQCLITRLDGEVNNVVKSKILFSNQDLVEKNTIVTRRTDKTILSQDEMLKFLRHHVAEKEVPKLKELLGLMSKNELRHIDFLIYLTGIYETANKNLLLSILDILNEDEIAYKKLLTNFT